MRLVVASRDLLGHLSADVISGEVVVLALPRGGVPVALPVAEVLRAPLDVLLVRKLGVPHHPELAMGAIGEGGTIVRNDAVVRRARVSDTSWRRVVRKETAEVARQRSLFRAERPAVDLNGVTSVIVDDGIATGSTVEAACQIAIHGGRNPGRGRRAGGSARNGRASARHRRRGGDGRHARSVLGDRAVL